MPACRSSALSGRWCAWRAAWGQGGVASGGQGAGLRRSGQPRLRSSGYVWAPGRCQAGWSLRARAGLRLGLQEAPRTAGDAGGQRPAGSQTLPGPHGPQQETGWGRPCSLCEAGSGEAQGGQVRRPPRPSPHPPGPRRRQPTRFPRLWDSPDKNTGVGCHFLLRNRGLLFHFAGVITLLAY